MKKLLIVLSILTTILFGCSKNEVIDINEHDQHYLDSLQHIQDSINYVIHIQDSLNSIVIPDTLISFNSNTFATRPESKRYEALLILIDHFGLKRLKQKCPNISDR